MLTRIIVAALMLSPFVIAIVRGVRRENQIARDIEAYSRTEHARALARRESRLRD